MQERTVLLLVVVLVVSTAGAGVAVNLFRPTSPVPGQPFDLSLSWNGTAGVGSAISLTVTLRDGTLDSRSLWAVFLSLDVGTMTVTSATPASNPWGYPTVWNLTGADLSATHFFNATAVPTQAGTAFLYAMVWVPQGDVQSAPVDASGHVNPAGVTLETVASLSISVPAGA